MKEIVFVTSNAGKVKTLERKLDQNKYKVVQENIDLPEIQANNALEIATFKARYAYEKLDRPVIVQDSSFHITALKGFPGPYIKYVNETLGPNGILKLVEGVDDRSAHFELALVYIDEASKEHSFVNIARAGSLAEAVYQGDSENSWSSLWKIYIPPEHTKTLAELTPEELKTRDAGDGDNSEFAQFIRWLKEQ